MIAPKRGVRCPFAAGRRSSPVSTPIPENAAALSIAEIVKLCGGELLQAGDKADVRGVFTDTRQGASGKLFVALRGERFDGHAFLDQAADGGTSAMLVEREVAPQEGVAVIRVASTLDALGALANAHRRRWGGKVVVVAGSAGKTTTKATIAAALRGTWPDSVHVTAGNLNNRVGVPMVLLALTEAHRVAVVEIGTNQPGEVEALSKIAEPDLAVLTLVAIEHSEGLGDLDAIEREEAAVFAGLSAKGVIVANRDDPRAWRSALAATAATRIGYGVDADASYRVSARESIGTAQSRLEIARPAGGNAELTVPLLGAPAALAVAAAVAVADTLAATPVPGSVLQAGLGSAEVLEAGRMQPVEQSDGTLLLDDSYNANPASVIAALQTAQELSSARAAELVLVLGEMRELGALSEREHKQIGEVVATTGARALVAIGGDAKHLVEPARAAGIDAVFVETSEAAVACVRERLAPGSVVLVKASRGVGADAVVTALRNGNGRAA